MPVRKVGTREALASKHDVLFSHKEFDKQSAGLRAEDITNLTYLRFSSIYRGGWY